MAVKLILEITNGEIKTLECEGLQQPSREGVTLFVTKDLACDSQTPVMLAKRMNGILITQTDQEIGIYNDPFRTLPVFFAYTSTNCLFLFSNFEDFYARQDIDKSIDSVGFWELVLFGNALWTTTLYQAVKQMPAASVITIKKSTNEIQVKRYWDFSIEENSTLISMEQAADGLSEHLDRLAKSLQNNHKPLILGISGGLDSRITLGYLARNIEKDRVNLFTFGYDDRILEYQYAKQIATALGCYKPIFHTLKASSYRRAMDYLPKLTGGQISINHCHIIDVVREHYNNTACFLQISTYLSDALFGYACHPEKKLPMDDVVDYFEILTAAKFIDDIVTDQIAADIDKILEYYPSNANFSSINEYKYLVERNPKFHTYLAHTQGSYVDTKLLYADYDLLEYMFSVTIRFRSQKRILETVLQRHIPELALSKIGTVSSRDFNNIFKARTRGSAFNSFSDWLEFRALNTINAILRSTSLGQYQILNRYQTENYEDLLRNQFLGDLRMALNSFMACGVVNEAQANHFLRIPVRATGAGARFQVITAARAMQESPCSIQ